MKDGGAPPSLPTVLVALADAPSRAALDTALEGIAAIVTADSPAEAVAALQAHDIAAVVSGPSHEGSSNAGGQPGAEASVALLADLQEGWPEVQRILAAAPGRADLAATVDTARAHHVLPAPLDPAQARITVAAACRQFRLARDNARLELELRLRAGPERRRTSAAALTGDGRDAPAFADILRAPSSPMAGVVTQAARLATFDVAILLNGAPGTGKAGLARAIHRASLRSDRPFHALDCAGLPDTALAAELFGARHGALPGLTASRAGLAQRAHRGTLFLNRVETLGPEMQLALLRLIEDGVARPLGSAEAQPAQPRLIAGSAVDLAAEVAAGRFGAELYYALAVTELTLPPLSARGCDIPALAGAMLDRAADLHGKPVQGFAREALAFLARYDWPGNLRELDNEVTRMLIAAESAVLGPELISRRILQHATCGCCCDADATRDDAAVMAGDGTLKARLETIEARILGETLTRLKWNKSRAAGELGLSRVGLRAKLDRHGLAPPTGGGTSPQIDPSRAGAPAEQE